ncbi:MAG: hypothetical protein QOG04_900 [Actinomycetota bacterium]|jgi:hypothetical protein|nr:hypothetical protein [Actinomycetota bacterium]
MADPTLVELEAAIKALPGVLGCVILTDGDGAPSEIQAFTRLGTEPAGVQTAVEAEVAGRGLAGSLRQVFVFELEAESHFGDRETLERAAELAEQEARTRGPHADASQELRSLQAVMTHGAPGSVARPPLLRVNFTSSSRTSEATVALGSEHSEVVGEAVGEKTPHGLKVLAEATLEAVDQLIGDSKIQLIGASLVSVIGSEAVLVVVKEIDGPEMLGAALVRGGPVTEAAVRATLDAVNRRLMQGA